MEWKVTNKRNGEAITYQCLLNGTTCTVTRRVGARQDLWFFIAVGNIITSLYQLTSYNIEDAKSEALEHFGDLLADTLRVLLGVE